MLTLLRLRPMGAMVCLVTRSTADGEDGDRGRLFLHPWPTVHEAWAENVLDHLVDPGMKLPAVPGAGFTLKPIFLRKD